MLKVYSKSNTIFYTNHAVKQMFQRNISTAEVESALQKGEIIMNYPDDKPSPSKLLFSTVDSRPLHIVFSFDNETQTTIIITAYEPSSDIWENNFVPRKKQ